MLFLYRPLRRTGYAMTAKEAEKPEHGQSLSQGSTPSTSAIQVPARSRTDDVLADKSFADLGLPASMISALAACGYDRPSPVQQHAIPLGRLGSDLIVQAKSGTGKTVVFATILLERVNAEETFVQALALAPTRELAIQTEQVINRLAAALPTTPAITCAAFVGGLPIVNDEKRLRRLLHIAVGTPGRVAALIQNQSLVCEKIKMFVLDEADSLLSESHYSTVTLIYDNLPKRKQVMAFSATYTPELLTDLEPLLKRPQRVMLCEETVSLKGVRQFYKLLLPPSHSAAATTSTSSTATMPPVAALGDQDAVACLSASGAQAGVGSAGGQWADKAALQQAKVEALLQLLAGCSFHQASVFCNDKPWAEWLARRLCAAGFPAVYLGGDLPQEDRQTAMTAVREFKTRVVVSTDVLARGVDLDRINLVVNMDVPRDAATYVHRVGRTGRFGTHGVAVCMVTPDELTQLKQYLTDVAGGHVDPLPDGDIPADLYSYQLVSDWEQQALEQLKQAPITTAPAPPSSTAASKADAAATPTADHTATSTVQPSSLYPAANGPTDHAHSHTYGHTYGSSWQAQGGVSGGPWGSDAAAHAAAWQEYYAQQDAWHAYQSGTAVAAAMPSAAQMASTNAAERERVNAWRQYYLQQYGYDPWAGYGDTGGSVTHPGHAAAQSHSQHSAAAEAGGGSAGQGDVRGAVAGSGSTAEALQGVPELSVYAISDGESEADVPKCDQDLNAHAARLLDGLTVLPTAVQPESGGSDADVGAAGSTADETHATQGSQREQQEAQQPDPHKEQPHAQQAERPATSAYPAYHYSSSSHQQREYGYGDGYDTAHHHAYASHYHHHQNPYSYGYSHGPAGGSDWMHHSYPWSSGYAAGAASGQFAYGTGAGGRGSAYEGVGGPTAPGPGPSLGPPGGSLCARCQAAEYQREYGVWVEQYRQWQQAFREWQDRARQYATHRQ